MNRLMDMVHSSGKFWKLNTFWALNFIGLDKIEQKLKALKEHDDKDIQKEWLTVRVKKNSRSFIMI